MYACFLTQDERNRGSRAGECGWIAARVKSARIFPSRISFTHVAFLAKVLVI